MKSRVLLAMLLATVLSGLPAESRSAGVDFVLLVDTSLSMADAIAGARQYAAGDILGRLVEPGDWVAILKFYGDTEVVWQGDVEQQSDVAAMVRSLNELKADGRFTDIGNALDAMDRLLLERGQPDRPKYILLLTDERQEAPRDSRYYSPDYVAEHPLLEYVKREDKGSFRVITIGYGLSARIEVEARTLMTTLSEPPQRTQAPLAGGGEAEVPAAPGQAGAPEKPASGAQADAAGKTSGTAVPQPGQAAPAPPATQPAEEPGVKATTVSSRGFSGAPIAAGLAAAGVTGIVVALFIAKRRRNKGKDEARSASEHAS